MGRYVQSATERRFNRAIPSRAIPRIALMGDGAIGEIGEFVRCPVVAVCLGEAVKSLNKRMCAANLLWVMTNNMNIATSNPAQWIVTAF